MRSSSISGRFEPLLLALAACSSTSPSPDAAAGCTIDSSGNTAEHADVAACAALSKGDAGGYTLSIDTSTTALARVSATVDLGSAPTAGSINDGAATAWNVVALANASSCAFQAGDATVPAGSFTLTLTSIDTTSSTAHGTLDVVAYVHAPPTTDCGYDDLEGLSIRF